MSACGITQREFEIGVVKYNKKHISFLAAVACDVCLFVAEQGESEKNQLRLVQFF